MAANFTHPTDFVPEESSPFDNRRPNGMFEVASAARSSAELLERLLTTKSANITPLPSIKLQ